MRERARRSASAILSVALLVGLVWGAAAGVDEYGANGTIPGVSFTGGDGSYTRAVKDGITLGIVPDFPWTYQDEKTKAAVGGSPLLDGHFLSKRLDVLAITYQPEKITRHEGH